jgi:class 3 adenylate cyclase/tetratricopeptide (TPR) repeat protein
MNISEWLWGLGLDQYAPAFRENKITPDLLPSLTAEDLKELGVGLVGDRRRLLSAIAALAPAPTAEPGPPPPKSVGRQEAERRQVTILFCDLVGSTTLSARLDPEDLRGVIGTYHRCCAGVIEAAGGFVAKYLGDGVLAYFGYPRADEHATELSVRAGLQLIEAVGRLETAANLPLQARVGIATGLVVVGDLIGEGAAQEEAVVGETPNLAARLQALAEPGSVVIGPETRRLTGGLFEYGDLGEIEIKGFAGTVRAARVLRTSAAESRFEARHGRDLTPLVGRNEELALLQRRWQQARGGDGCVVLVSGEPGIGKSRIAQTVLERLATEPHTRLRLFCSPHHQDYALYPTITQLEQAAGFRRDDTLEQRLDRLAAVLAQATSDLAEAVPLLAALLSLPAGERYPPLTRTPQKQKEKTLLALVAQVEGLAARQPVLMLFEDAHWIDPTSLELLDLIIDRVPALSLLLIITFRPEFTPPWVGRPHVTALGLNRLTPQQRAEMIVTMVGGQALPREITEQIVDRTDGVPLFVEELTKAVVESRTRTDAGDRYTATGPSAALAVPTTLQASLLARLDRLAPVREVAQIGAALGRHFSHELIAAVASMSRPKLDDALAQLVSAELIYRRGTPPDAGYTFKHALVQDAAYSTLLRSRRQQLHARITAVLEDQFRDVVAAQPALLAQHCEQAGLIEKAIGYWFNAGQQAITRSAMTEAISQLRKGLDLLLRMPDEATREAKELELQVALGHALMAAKGFSAAEPGMVYDRARELCERLNRPSELAPVLHGQLVYRFVRVELDRADHHAHEMLHLGDTLNDVRWKYSGLYLSGVLCSVMGKFNEACVYSEDALSLWDPDFRSFAASPEDPNLSVRLYYYRALLCLGHIDKARLFRNEALTEARRLSPFNVAYALYHSWLGDWAMYGPAGAVAMLRSADEVLAISIEQGFALWFAFGNLMRGWSLAMLGRADEATELLLRGLAGCGETGCGVVVPFWLAVAAEVYGHGGQSEQALQLLAQAENIIERTNESWPKAEVHRLRGTLLLGMHDTADAEKSFHRAIEVARQQSAKFWELRAVLALARLWRDQDRRREAH